MAGEAGAEVLTVNGISKDSRCASMGDNFRIARAMPSSVAGIVGREGCSYALEGMRNGWIKRSI